MVQEISIDLVIPAGYTREQVTAEALLLVGEAIKREAEEQRAESQRRYQAWLDSLPPLTDHEPEE